MLWSVLFENPENFSKNREILNTQKENLAPADFLLTQQVFLSIDVFLGT